jgi:peroxiredoxin
MSIEVGSPAPDFTLRNEDFEEVTLSSLRGRNVVLVFYPLSFSALCTKELRSVTEMRERFDDANAEVLGISIDSPFVQKAFRRQEGIEAHLLSDFHPKGAVADTYGVYVPELGTAMRATFVIDKDGRVAHKQVTALHETRDHAEALQALAACPL